MRDWFHWMRAEFLCRLVALMRQNLAWEALLRPKPIFCILGSIWEAPGRHLRGLWMASERHLGGSRIPGGSQRLQMAPGRKLCQNHCVFLSKVARPTISPARDESRCHHLRSLRTKMSGRKWALPPGTSHGPLRQSARNPTVKTVWVM